jgi:hypothetical protein
MALQPLWPNIPTGVVHRPQIRENLPYPFVAGLSLAILRPYSHRAMVVSNGASLRIIMMARIMSGTTGLLRSDGFK